MLKLCCDCITGVNNDNEIVHEATINDNLHRTQWPLQKLEKGAMYHLPTQLNLNDKIEMEGILNANPQSLRIGLMTGNYKPDHSNVACQIDVNFLNGEGNESIIIRKVNNGNVEEILLDDKPSDLFPELDFKFIFQIGSDKEIDVYVGESYLSSVQLSHNIGDITFLSVNNDVSKVKLLTFLYG